MPKLLNERLKEQNAVPGRKTTDSKDKVGKVAPAKPNARTQLVSVHAAPQQSLNTTNELKRFEEERVYQDEVEALKRARRRVRALKARAYDQTRMFKPEVIVKVVKKVHKPSAAPVPILPAKQQVPEEVEEEVGEDYEVAENEEEESEFPPEEQQPNSGAPEEEESEGLRETPSKQHPADWYTHPYKEGDDEVEVGTETVAPRSDKPRRKMYSVGIQVGPKKRSSAEESIMFAENVGVDSVDFSKATLGEEEFQRRWARGEAEGEGRRDGGWEEYKGEGDDWDTELEMDPEFQNLSPEVNARVRAERQRRLERKPGLRADAMTLARPTFYRELPLKATMEDALVQSKEAQTSEYEIEHTEATRRGLSLQENNILWPISKEFDIELGEMKIESYIRRCWKLDKEWLFHTRLIQTHTTEFRKTYIYEVIFSTPTPESPVPPATASVYFVFELVKYGSIEDSVKVSYVLEGSRYPHIPGQFMFQQKWLQGIVADKLSIQRRIDF